MKKLFLVDASNMFFRAYFAIPHMNAKDGLPTNALYGFLSMSVKLLRDLKPDYLVYCFDRKEPSFRNELYPEYKANRTEMPEDLVPQMEYIKKIPELLGIKCIEKSGLEADDLIGILAKQAEKEEAIEVVIVSGDKDFAQLVNSKVSLYDSMKDKSFKEEDVKAKWGVKPSQFIDYLALVGDSSDNIPGVRGVGPKTAEKLLKQYNDLDEIYKNLEVIKPDGLKKKLTENKEMAYLSQKLVTIMTEDSLNLKTDELNLQPIRKQELLDLFERLSFKSFEKKLFNEDSNAPSTEQKVKKAKSIEFETKQITTKDLEKDLEPYSDIWIHSDSRGVSVLYNNNQIAELGNVGAELGQVLESKHLNWQGYDVKKIARELSVKDINCVWDHMLAAYIVRSGKTMELKELCGEYLDEKLPELPSIESVFQALVTLKPILEKKLKSQAGLDVYNKIELPLIPVLLDMEANGIKINLDELKRQSDILESEISELEKKIFESTGQEFNIASPKQLGKVLFEDMELPVIKKTKTGYSTNSDVLNKLDHPVAELIVQYREATKLKSTYLDALPNLINKETGRIHTFFNQAVTTTGRLSSQNPNLQNIPIRTEKGRMIRRAFVAPEGFKLLSLDYSQIELRILAHITEDPALCKAFENDLDIHAATASEIFNIELEDVTSDLRRKAKAVNFGIAYGQGAYGLADSLGISRSEGKEIIERYFEKFKNVKKYMDTTIQQAREQGYVETLFGRRRYLDEFKSKNQMVVKFGERAAINAPIQGAASDLVKLAMIEVHESIKSKVLLQVHDELLLECPTEKVDSEALKVKKIMENIAALRVPLKVNYASGDNWEQAHG